MPGSRLLQQQELQRASPARCGGRWPNRLIAIVSGALHPVRKPSDEVRRSLDRRPMVD
jgi:hypothetical protein